MKMTKKLDFLSFTFFPIFMKKKKKKAFGFYHFVVLPKWIINSNEIAPGRINNGLISLFFVGDLYISFHLARIAIGLAISIDKNITIDITQQMTVKVLNWTCWSSYKFNLIFFFHTVTSNHWFLYILGCYILNRFPLVSLAGCVHNVHAMKGSR